MALIGFILSLYTQEIRRAHDAGLPKDRTLPLYLAVFVGVWVAGLAVVAVREMQARHQRARAGGVSPPRAQAANVPRSEQQRLPLVYVLATVALIALAGLAVTMLAVQISAQRASRPAVESPIQIVAPAELPGLGYLPSDSDLVAGIHVAEAFEDPMAREFLVKLSFRVGKENLSLLSLEQMTGLKLRDIDHVALGLRLKNSLLFPRMTLVVRMRRPYDAEAVLKALRASPAPEPDKKELYKITLGGSVLDRVALLWLADDTTLIFGLSANDFSRVPTKPRTGVDDLPRDIGVLIKRLAKGTPAWIVGSPESWEKSTAWEMLIRRGKDDPGAKALAKVRALGAWLQFGGGMTFRGVLECADPATAKALEEAMSGADPERKPLKLTAPSPTLEPIYKELGRTFSTKLKGTRLTLEARASPETMRKALGE
jgi:hypothetical protein